MRNPYKHQFIGQLSKTDMHINEYPYAYTPGTPEKAPHKAGLGSAVMESELVVFLRDGADIRLAVHAAAEFLPCPG